MEIRYLEAIFDDHCRYTLTHSRNTAMAWSRRVRILAKIGRQVTAAVSDVEQNVTAQLANEVEAHGL